MFEQPPTESKETAGLKEQEFRRKLIDELDKKETKIRAEQEKFAADDPLFSKNRGESSIEFTAVYNLKRILEEKKDVPIPALIKEIEGFLTRDQEEINKIEQSGKEPAPGLVRGSEIQKRKLEILREIAGL